MFVSGFKFLPFSFYHSKLCLSSTNPLMYYLLHLYAQEKLYMGKFYVRYAYIKRSEFYFYFISVLLDFQDRVFMQLSFERSSFYITCSGYIYIFYHGRHCMYLHRFLFMLLHSSLCTYVTPEENTSPSFVGYECYAELQAILKYCTDPK